MNYSKLTKKEMIEVLTSIVYVPKAEIEALKHDYTKKEVSQVLSHFAKNTRMGRA